MGRGHGSDVTRGGGAASRGPGPRVDEVIVRAFTVPIGRPESDGTLEWDSTTLVLAQIRSGEDFGLGYSYADATAATLIRTRLAPLVEGYRITDIPKMWWAMVAALRNIGRPGVGMTAVSAVDTALWDLKARTLDVSLIDLLGRVREAVPVYGSGGFTSLSVSELKQQLGDWASAGFPAVKMKVGRNADDDADRVEAARAAIGPGISLMVDANGAYDRKQALALADVFVDAGVDWFEEPVSSDDLESLRLLRDRLPPSMEIAAGEYGYDPVDFVRLLDVVDVLQADVTRCGGITGFLRVAAFCEGYSIPLSSHTAPALHVALGCAARPVRHVEYFQDHVRIEHRFFDGVAEPVAGALRPDPGRPGLGLELREDVVTEFELEVPA